MSLSVASESQKLCAPHKIKGIEGDEGCSTLEWYLNKAELLSSLASVKAGYRNFNDLAFIRDCFVGFLNII